MAPFVNTRTRSEPLIWPRRHGNRFSKSTAVFFFSCLSGTQRDSACACVGDGVRRNVCVCVFACVVGRDM